MSSLIERVRESNFSTFIRRYFPNDKVQKISVSASNACPLHEKGRGEVCSYCSNSAFSPAYALRDKPFEEQLSEGINFFRHKYPSMKYLAYFQSYTATYGNPDRLIQLFHTALAYPEVVGLIVATRPDLMPQRVLDALKELSKKYFVMVEYGIESTQDTTLKRVNRGHSYSVACDTILRTYNAGLPVGAHLILGLPGESRTDMLRHAVKLNELPLDTLKLHHLQILKGSRMAEEYAADPSQYHLFTIDEYIEFCLDFLSLLKPTITVERFVASAPDTELIAPRWGVKNYAFIDRLLKAAASR